MSSIAENTLSGPAPVYTLFDSGAVAAATIFGTPVAGGSLMALNYRRLGHAGKAAATLFVAIAVTAVVMLVGWNLPQGVVFPIGLVLLYLMRQSARSLQGTAVTDHVQRGGRLGSRWAALGIGTAFLAALLAVIFFAVIQSNRLPKTFIVIGSNNNVYYSDAATIAEAQALGNALNASGYFTGAGADVFLTKGKTGAAVSFIVKEGTWDQTVKVALFDEVGREVAPSVGGFPIQVRLLNNARDIKEESTVGRVAFPANDDVYYFGAVKESEARTFGQRLTSVGFFRGRGNDVFLSKHSDGTVLSFVVQQGASDDPAIVSSFEKIVRQTASAVGGLPVTLRLVTPSLKVEKSEVVK